MAGRRHYATSGVAEGRFTSFDGFAYLASYEDLRTAFGTNVTAALRHYIQHGANEGRSITFDAFGYLASYADLRAAYGIDPSSAARHFIEFGEAEGRSITFDAFGYLASYADLRAAYGVDPATAARHFIEFGEAEGRSLTFDALAYIASYEDLRSAFGTDATAGANHFVRFGADEGRKITFDGVAYLLGQHDLATAGLGLEAALRHWIVNGADEGRSAAGAFGTEQVGHLLQLSDALTDAVDSRGDVDWFQIDLAAGDAVSFDLLTSSGRGVLSIHDASGRTVSPQAVIGATTSFAVTNAGTYYLVISMADSAMGTYTLAATEMLDLAVNLPMAYHSNNYQT